MSSVDAYILSSYGTVFQKKKKICILLTFFVFFVFVFFCFFFLNSVNLLTIMYYRLPGVIYIWFVAKSCWPLSRGDLNLVNIIYY